MSEWKNVTMQEFSDAYLVSDEGEIFSLRTGKLLKNQVTKTGYCRVTLSTTSGQSKKVSVHRVVALAFIENPHNKPTVNHINENKKDNRAVNLEWMTNAEQNAYGTRTERAMQNTDWKKRSAKVDYKAIARKHNYSSKNMCNRKMCAVYRGGEIVGYFDTLKEAAKFTGANYSKASEVAKGTRKTAGGYVFSYIEEFPMAVTKLRFSPTVEKG